eukprot:s2602_g7.t1
MHTLSRIALLEQQLAEARQQHQLAVEAPVPHSPSTVSRTMQVEEADEPFDLFAGHNATSIATPMHVGTARLHLPAPEPSGHCPAATARSQWALPDFSRDCQIAVGTAGLQPRLPDHSGHCWVSTASPRSQWALPDISRVAVGTAGLQPVYRPD